MLMRNFLISQHNEEFLGMKKSVFYSIIGLLIIQAFIYTILSLGSVIDLITYASSGSQPDLTYLSVLAIPFNNDLSVVTSAWSVIISLSAVITFLALAYIYELKSDIGRIWFILAIATALWFGGEFIWFYLTITTGVPDQVTLADFSWLLGYPFYFLGLFLLNRQIGLPTGKRKFYLFTAILGIFSIIALYVLGVAIFTPDSALIDSLVYYAYVLGDLIMLYLAGLIFMKFSSGAEIRRSYMILILAFLITAIADFIFDFSYYVLGIYQTYSFDIADAFYIIGYTLLTVGALTYYHLVSSALAD